MRQSPGLPDRLILFFLRHALDSRIRQTPIAVCVCGIISRVDRWRHRHGHAVVVLLLLLLLHVGWVQLRRQGAFVFDSRGGITQSSMFFSLPFPHLPFAHRRLILSIMVAVRKVRCTGGQCARQGDGRR